jgi:hypothetical protein
MPALPHVRLFVNLQFDPGAPGFNLQYVPSDGAVFGLKKLLQIEN